MRYLTIALFILLSGLSTAQAHKVIASVYASGKTIEGEIGFSNGDMATDTLVEVFDPSGNRLGEAVTDGDGFFVYTPTLAVAHTFRANLGAGHVAEVTMPVEELPTGLATGSSSDAGEASAVSSQSGDASLSADQEAMLAEIVRKEIKPLRRELAAYKEKNNIQNILGGIGYILGIAGIGFYIQARRKMQERD